MASNLLLQATIAMIFPGHSHISRCITANIDPSLSGASRAQVAARPAGFGGSPVHRLRVSSNGDVNRFFPG